MGKILNWFFKRLRPKKPNWLSIRFALWEHDRRKELNERIKKVYQEDGRYAFFDVPGAGQIMISESVHYSCGNVIGFDFGVEWGGHGFCGGVIGRAEAKRLANFIMDKCSSVTETEQEERDRRDKERRQQFEMP